MKPMLRTAILVIVLCWSFIQVNILSLSSDSSEIFALPEVIAYHVALGLACIALAPSIICIVFGKNRISRWLFLVTEISFWSALLMQGAGLSVAFFIGLFLDPGGDVAFGWGLLSGFVMLVSIGLALVSGIVVMIRNRGSDCEHEAAANKIGKWMIGSGVVINALLIGGLILYILIHAAMER